MPAQTLKIQGLWIPSLPASAHGTAEPHARESEELTRGSRLGVDPQVVALCRTGDPDAFDTLFEATKDHVYTLALHFSGDESAAADVTQEVFLKLLERIGQFREDAEFSTWLYRVVLNTFLDQRRSRRPWIPLHESAAAETLPRELTLEAVQEDKAARLRIAADVRRAVAGLKPRWRALVVLRYSAGLSYEEIAEVLEISPGTVASRLHRAHARLAKTLCHLRDRVT